MMQTYFHYIGKVWIHHNPVPLTDDGLKDFDPLVAKPDYDAFLSGGGVVPVDEGMDLEEMWLFSQLISKCEMNCLLNSNSPGPPPGRIRHLVSLPAKTLVMQLVLMLQNPAVNEEGMMSLLVYDGFFGHVINANTFDQELGRFVYYDPWPGTSLLCKQCNRAGVDAQPAQPPYDPRLWTLSAEEMQKVIYAVMVPLPPNNPTTGMSPPIPAVSDSN